MWNLNDALAFATGSAATAIDQAYSHDYPTLQDSIDSHRQNLVDTLVEYRAQIWEEEALQAFDDAIRAARRNLIADAAALTDEDAAIMLASPARYAMHDYCSAENDRAMANTRRASLVAAARNSIRAVNGRTQLTNEDQRILRGNLSRMRMVIADRWDDYIVRQKLDYVRAAGNGTVSNFAMLAAIEEHGEFYMGSDSKWHVRY